jgi:hypothetical protein
LISSYDPGDVSPDIFIDQLWNFFNLSGVSDAQHRS